VVRLGYVGLPLVHAFAQHFDVVGFDVNKEKVALMKQGIDTLEVLRAAGTKWNFLKFFPGLVGGHCIGVDPYYLTYKAEELGYHPEVILSGRRINDNMGKFVAENTVKKLIKTGKAVKGAKVLLLGLTFKEDVGDIRNTKVVDIVAELNDYQVETCIYDPYANADEVRHEYGLEILSELPEDGSVDAVILAVPHKRFGEILLRNRIPGDTIPNSANSGHVPGITYSSSKFRGTRSRILRIRVMSRNFSFRSCPGVPSKAAGGVL
jgi:UDP-N-acetyl-D-mannosaminuronate dehydrogenase